jgi:hypothetical protein
MKRALLTALLAAACGPLWAQAPRDLAPFGWFADLAGSCWQGEQPDGKPADTQCYSVQYGRLLRGTIKMTVAREGAPPALFEGDSVFAPDAAGKRIVFTQWASNGSYATGEMTVEGDTLHFVNRAPDGAPPKVRHLWRRLDADSFRVTRERRDGEGWREALSATYRRVR